MSNADVAAAGMRRAFIVELAREQYQREGAIEIDEGAVLSEGNDNGTYVAAWVWVSFDGTPFDKLACLTCRHSAEEHALDGRGVTPDPYCEADDCECAAYVAQLDEAV